MTARRLEALRRLGREMTTCDWCQATMGMPADPFEGPRVIWHPDSNGDVYRICSSGCHDRLRAKLKGDR